MKIVLYVLKGLIPLPQRFIVGHFWSLCHTTIEGIFRKLLINIKTSISCKYSVLISCKTPYFHAISSILTVSYDYTKTTVPSTKEKLYGFSFLFYTPL